jgi:integrase
LCWSRATRALSSRRAGLLAVTANSRLRKHATKRDSGAWLSNVEPIRLRNSAASARRLSKGNTTFGVVADAYFREALPNQRRGREVKREITRLFINDAGWGARPIHEITTLDVRNVIRRYAEQGKIFHACNVLSYARRLFNWAIDQQCFGIDISPCDRLKPKRIIGSKQPRTRVLNDTELRTAWLAAGNMPYPWGPIFQLLLLLGQRRGEVVDMRWSEIDLPAKTWTIPNERMKACAAHVVPLPDDAVAIIEKLPRHAGPYVFTANGGQSPVRSYGEYKCVLDAEMAKLLGGPVAKFVVHDFRRTMRTRLSAIPNISDLVRELVIGHTKPGLHKVYDQYAYLDEKRFALEAWAARLSSIVNPPPVNVVELRAAP